LLEGNAAGSLCIDLVVGQRDIPFGPSPTSRPFLSEPEDVERTAILPDSCVSLA
jgi:hypothetical protein